MAMKMYDDVLGADALLAKLGKVLADERSFLLVTGIIKDVRFLGSELSNIRDEICHYESLHEPFAQIKLLVNRARELAYDGEDWADLLLHRVRVRGAGCSYLLLHRIRVWGGGGCTALYYRILSRLRCRDSPVHRVIVSELRELTERVVPLIQVIQHWKRLSLELHEPVDSRQNTRFVDVGSLVGFDGPMEEVTKMVIGAGAGAGAGGKAELLKIVSIVGMAGSGKTTLATAVYQQLIRQHNRFHLHAFVSVGQTQGQGMGKQALQDMLSELGDGHQEQEGPLEDNINIDQLISRLREILVSKSYLIVVDDLWSMEDWQTIKRCFPEDSLAGSRIIATTRNLALAMGCSSGSSDCVYNIGLLSEADSKKLILDRAFGIGHGCPQHLEDVVAQITRRCSGLPLALVTLPSMLEDKSSKDEWDRLVRSRWLSRPDAKPMKQTLNLSYSDLHQHLKTCLLVLSIFPEDFKVDVDRLVRRCIAEGYILAMPYLCDEEIARRCINELISKNIVQPLHLIHGAPRYCRLHPVIHDFIACKSMEDNFVTLVDDQNSPIVSSNCYRLSVQIRKQDQHPMLYDFINLSHVRSISVFGQASTAPCLTNLCVVRVLDLEGCVGPVCLDGLDKLPLLRYLSLKGTDVTELPATIWELRFLESLDVRSTKVKQLPPSIVGLRDSLRTLLFGRDEGVVNSDETSTTIAEDIQHCRRLENVASIDLREHPATVVKALGHLSNLRMLEITWSFQQCTDAAYYEALLSSMEKWISLQSLTIHCGVGCCMEFLDSLVYPPMLQKFKVIAGSFVSVPRWIQMLDYLSFLQITICKIGTDDLKILSDLPQLQCLILGLDFVPRNTIVIESEGFSEVLRFSVNCPVPWLTFQVGAMPKLTRLQLEFCSGSTNPESVPFGIGNLQRLTEVDLLYNQKWCVDSSSVRMTVDAVKRQVVKHPNQIDLIINDNKVDVQEVDSEMKSVTKVHSGDIEEETARTAVETTLGEIEIEAECGNIGSTY